jgi:hypothetical protein
MLQILKDIFNLGMLKLHVLSHRPFGAIRFLAAVDLANVLPLDLVSAPPYSLLFFVSILLG